MKTAQKILYLQILWVYVFNLFLLSLSKCIAITSAN